MRISVDPDDPGYGNWLKVEPDKRSKIVITLNGEELVDVFTADEALGLVVVPMRNPGFMVEDNKVTRVTRRGKVSITVPA